MCLTDRTSPQHDLHHSLEAQQAQQAQHDLHHSLEAQQAQHAQPDQQHTTADDSDGHPRTQQALEGQRTSVECTGFRFYARES